MTLRVICLFDFTSKLHVRAKYSTVSTKHVSNSHFLFLDVPIPSWSKPRFLQDADNLNMNTPLTNAQSRSSICDDRVLDNTRRSQPVYPQNSRCQTVYLL